MQRTLSQVGAKLGAVRDRIFSLAQPQRHHLILDLNAATGLLTWEAIRSVPEGGVYAYVRTPGDGNALFEQAAALPELMRPIILTGLTELADIQFDRIIGRNVLMDEPDKTATVEIIAKLLRPEGMLILAETIPRHTQRLYRLLDEKKIAPDLYQRLVVAEEDIYTHQSDPMLNWDVDDLRNAFAGLVVEVETERSVTPMHITPVFVNRLFVNNPVRPSYADRLGKNLKEEEVRAVQELFNRYLLNQTVAWESTIAFVLGSDISQHTH